MNANQKCKRCERSTRSPKATTCPRCLRRDETRAWLLRTARVDGECLVADVEPNSDGMVRVATSTRGEFGTKTTATIQGLFPEEAWHLPAARHDQCYRPTCGKWGCLVEGHWRLVRRRSDRERLALAHDLFEAIFENLSPHFLEGVDDKIREELQDRVYFHHEAG